MRKFRVENIDLAHLRSLMHYDPLTGVFTWIKARKGVTVGAVAGRLGVKGYWHIGIEWQYYTGHRLAWFYMTGRWPKEQIDHKNMVRSDNRFCNLREATQSNNMANIPKNAVNKSGYKGVVWHKNNKKWQVQLRVNGKRLYLGLHDELAVAASIYAVAAAKYHGEFGRAA